MHIRAYLMIYISWLHEKGNLEQLQTNNGPEYDLVT